MSSNTEISHYLGDIFHDWENSRGDYPNNIYLTHYWPIPFFGNPATARVATVGVNPSSGEFGPERDWASVENHKQWKERLKHYFGQSVPAHEWFNPWREGLALLDSSYEQGTAAHLDVSYRPTKAMLRNPNTDRGEFRHIVERDVAWLFRLLPLCPQLRGLLVYGRIVRHDGTIESLAAFVRKSAPRHGFMVLPDGGLRHEHSGSSSQKLFLHEVDSTGEGTVTEKVVADLTRHKDELQRRIHNPVEHAQTPMEYPHDQISSSDAPPQTAVVPPLPYDNHLVVTAWLPYDVKPGGAGRIHVAVRRKGYVKLSSNHSATMDAWHSGKKAWYFSFVVPVPRGHDCYINAEGAAVFEHTWAF